MKCFRAISAVLALYVVLFSGELHLQGASTPGAEAKPRVDANRLDLPTAGQPNLESNIERPLRYRPDGTDFVITNGPQFFNRPLYGSNSAFRIDAGDKPEFGLYLPGRGGNLRLGIRVGDKAKWLNNADTVVARYRPGSMVYEIHDSLLGPGILRVTALGLADTPGLIVRAEIEGASNVTLLAAYGGANGEKGSHNVDIGCDRVPVDEWFRLKPEYCRGSQFSVDGATFVLKAKGGTVGGFFSPGTQITVGDAGNWDHPETLSSSPQSSTPIAVATSALVQQSPVYIMLKPASVEGAPSPGLAETFEAAEKHRQDIAGKIVVETPDPYINAAASALCVAADGVWDESMGVWMHGAVAWRNPLLGWRGDYIGDALGWHNRAQRDFDHWAAKQNISPIPAQLPAPEAKDNLSRNEVALHSNGDMSGTHYDMNLVFIDALFRHLLWTGDVNYARKMWPVIERHLAWERRLFRREYGPDKLPLYEAYCCIWASDDLWYSGGGAAHSTAYNYYQNKMAARVAKLIGEDPSPYEHEADLIGQAMRKYLWLADVGAFAESKDWLGLQRTHDSPALWSIYTPIDSQVPTAEEARQMMRYVDTQIAHIPVRGPGVPSGDWFTLPTSNWMPYDWSTNNVVMAESAHTALAYWQADRSETAFQLFKGCILDSMFMGICPGNVGMCTQYDMARAEAQRDFGDGVGMVSRGLVEGLFGVNPDALSGQLTIRPGFPKAWDHASLSHPDIDFKYVRNGLTETYTIQQKFAKPMALRLEAAPLGQQIASVTVNGTAQKWTAPEKGQGERFTVECPTNANAQITIKWQGESKNDESPAPAPITHQVAQGVDWNAPVHANLDCVTLDSVFNDSVTQIFKNEYLSPRSPFCSLSIPKQGYSGWCHPTDTFVVNDTGLRAVAQQNGGRIVLPNGVPLQTPGAPEGKNIAFVSQWDNYPKEISVPLTGKASHAYLLMAGSTNSNQSRFDNGEVIISYTDGTAAHIALTNPTTWWPIDQDYLIDDYAFRRPEPIPPRVDLKTGKIRLPTMSDLSRRGPYLRIDGGAATVLDLSLDPTKQLKSLSVHALANEVVIGLMSVTLAR